MTKEELRDYVEEQRSLNNIPYHVYSELIYGLDTLEQEPQTFKWCTDCKEYDQEKHCCHRWSKVIRDTVEEMKQEQEPIKPMVEIDLYSVIKQKYIEREVLNKIRAEIEQKIEAERFARSVFRGEEKDTFMAEQCTGSIFAYNNVIKLIDKYKSESEEM